MLCNTAVLLVTVTHRVSNACIECTRGYYFIVKRQSGRIFLLRVHTTNISRFIMLKRRDRARRLVLGEAGRKRSRIKITLKPG